MKELFLKRVADTGQETCGVLCQVDFPLCLTLENAWRDNQVNISCIPAGRYKVDLNHQSPAFGRVILIKDVEGRTYSLFHWGNTSDDTEGCVLVGNAFGRVKGNLAVTSSKKTFQQLLKTLDDLYPDGECYINIVDATSLETPSYVADDSDAVSDNANISIEPLGSVPNNGGKSVEDEGGNVSISPLGYDDSDISYSGVRTVES